MTRAMYRHAKIMLLACLGLLLFWAIAVRNGAPSLVDITEANAIAAEQQLAQAPKNAGRKGPQRVAQKDQPMLEHPFPRRAQSESLDGGVDWLNTEPLDLKDLRGKFVILDFWTYCCINCMHILPELKKLEKAYPNNLVVIGVHSAKFDEEKDSQNIRDAIMRYEIEHPVINDSNHVIWNKFAVNSWPSLRVIDPQGDIVAMHSGEIDFDSMDQFLKNALPYYRGQGLLNETPIEFALEASKAQKTPLRYPGKVLADEAGGRLFISDSNHNRIVIAGLDGTLIDIIGSGAIGKQDGDYATAQFDHPQGVTLHGSTLYVADTENHLLRKVDLEKKTVVTIAGTGEQARGPWPGVDESLPGRATLPARFVGPPATTGLNSPWDVLVHENNLYIAMAGPHQIWKMPLDESEIGPYAGNGREDIVDGPLLPKRPYETGFSSFAQPSGLASDGEWLYVADSEGSSIRAVPFNPSKRVRTIVGTSGLSGGRLFTFGDVDGRGDQVLLQHVLGVTYHDGSLYIADTYNNKIKTINVAKTSATTLAGTGEAGSSDEPAMFDEPAGISYAGGKLYVADTNNHLIRVVDAKTGAVKTLEIEGLTPPQPGETPRPTATAGFPGAVEVNVEPITVKANDGQVQVAVRLSLPFGHKINPLAPMKYLVETTAESGPVDRAEIGKKIAIAEPKSELTFSIPVKESTGSETVKISLPINYCEVGDAGLCKVAAVSWIVPLTLSADADNSVLKLEHQVD